MICRISDMGACRGRDPQVENHCSRMWSLDSSGSLELVNFSVPVYHRGSSERQILLPTRAFTQGRAVLSVHGSQ